MPCNHITNDIIVPDSNQYVRWFCARNVPFHLFDGGGTSLQMKTKDQLCSEGPLECVRCCEVRIASLYYLKYQTCELPSLTLHQCKTAQPTLNIMSAKEKSSLHISCPLGKCGEGSLYPHVVQVALATDAWGAVRAHPSSNGVLVDDQAYYWATNNCCYVGKRPWEEKLLLGDCARA